MRVRLLAVSVCAAALALVGALVGEPVVIASAHTAGATPPIHYVALGDSYSSGVGAEGASGSCGRSPAAYPALFDAAVKPASYTFAACSGATTADVRGSQLSSVSASTTLASITIGGNDVGVTSVLETCILRRTDDCVAAVNGAESTARTTLPGLLASTYAAIRAKAPKAEVVVLSYPAFYDLGPRVCLGLSRTDHQKIDEGIGVLDGVVQTAAGNAGFTFADVRNAFTGHEICDGGSTWLHALNYGDIDESYHPTAAGQSGGYLPAFRSAAGL